MAQIIPETQPDYEDTRFIERPDGFYWCSRAASREYGPFATLLEAIQDMQQEDQSSFEPGESLDEAKEEIGIAGWTDPETGEPAEDTVPRIEDH
jgi:hypothetical protein